MNLLAKIAAEMTKEQIKLFIDLHKSQLLSLGLPELYWEDLYMKLKGEIFDAGYHFQIRQRVNEDDEILGFKSVCINEKGLDLSDPAGVFLIDHAWTYHVNDSRACLRQNHELLKRICNMMSISEPVLGENNGKIIEEVFEKMWKYNQTYQLGSANLTDEEHEPFWYIMDEFGSSIRHNEDPSVKCAPFYFLENKTMFSVMWPVKTLEAGDELTRDYVYGTVDETLRRCKTLPYLEDADEEDYELGESNPTQQDEPADSYFNNARADETLPDASNLNETINLGTRNDKINVFTDIEAIKENLTDERFVITDNIQTADIRFLMTHFKDYKDLQEKYPNCLVNQFPFENVVTVKDMLAIVSRRVQDSKKWLPITYNLDYELPKFITYYKQREEECLDNYWIVKPWNLARSMDTTITKNLNQIIRCQETGPKIACKYIQNPVLYYRQEVLGNVKFDIRYIVLLRSVEPLKIFCYNVFWLRFANKKYSLDNLDDYEKHFTVMNYKDFVLKQVHYDEFIPEFEDQNKNYKWKNIEGKIYKMIRQIFEGAIKQAPPRGIAHNPQSRAMYAVDLMLDWQEDENGIKTIEPMVCEMNFMPDCTRACQYHPSFFNDVFRTLFLDDTAKKNVTEI